MHELLVFVKQYALVLTSLGAICAFIWPIWQFVLVRRRDAANRDFEIFHRLIKELVQGDGEDKVPMVDRQCATLYELRNFKQYYPITYRIIEGLINNEWRHLQNSDHRMAVEMRLTLKHIRASKCDLEVMPTSSPSTGPAPNSRRLGQPNFAAPASYKMPALYSPPSP